MRTETKYFLEEGDLELIQKGIPENPCVLRKCTLAEQRSCLGCPDYARWSKTIAELKERGIYELAVQEQERINAREEIRQLQTKLEAAQRKLNSLK